MACCVLAQKLAVASVCFGKEGGPSAKPRRDQGIFWMLEDIAIDLDHRCSQ
jgi:hypothetical protein